MESIRMPFEQEKKKKSANIYPIILLKRMNRTKHKHAF